MSPFVLFSVTAVALFCLGLHALIRRVEPLRKVLAVNVMGSAVFLLLGAIAHRNRGEVADPVPHAMVLTGIVVSVSLTAFALSLVRRLHALRGESAAGPEAGG